MLVSKTYKNTFQVAINIENANDSPPVFEKSIFTAEVPEDLSPG